MTRHAGDIKGDRATGEYWEREFQSLAWKYLSAKTFKNSFYDPDFLVMCQPREYHEIKHKAPFGKGRFGLEEYRLEALVEFQRNTREDVLYTIHDWREAGATSSKWITDNLMKDWKTALVLDLWKTRKEENVIVAPSYRSGQHGETMRIQTWPMQQWRPLWERWSKFEIDAVIITLCPKPLPCGC